MTNVSKQSLQQKTQDELFEQLAKIFTTANHKQTATLFSDLFTPAEKIMFMKRLAIILMLHNQQSTYRIAQLLKVSDATVRRLQRAYTDGSYEHITAVVEHRSFNREKFWHTMEALLRGGMPPYGKDRWKGFGVHHA